MRATWVALVLLAASPVAAAELFNKLIIIVA